MLRPEHRQFDSLDRLSAYSERSTVSSPGNRSRVLAESSELEALMESLVPKGISPSKQAVIERLVEMWVAKSDLDVA